MRCFAMAFFLSFTHNLLFAFFPFFMALYSPWIQHWASLNSSKFEFFSSRSSVLRYHISMSSIDEVDFKAISMFCILNVEMVMNWNPPYSVFIYPYVHTLNNSKRKLLAINSIIKLPNFFFHGNNIAWKLLECRPTVFFFSRLIFFVKLPHLRGRKVVYFTVDSNSNRSANRSRGKW